MLSTPELDRFRRHYQLRPPERSSKPHQSLKIGLDNGLRILEEAPISGVAFGCPPRHTTERGSHTYIWVIDDSGIPYVLEVPIPSLDGNAPKHTNLTGGGNAYVGGQLWFQDTFTMYVSGGSGRFPPLTEEQLDTVVTVFESFNYAVNSLGWNHETGRARRVLQEY